MTAELLVFGAWASRADGISSERARPENVERAKVVLSGHTSTLYLPKSSTWAFLGLGGTEKVCAEVTVRGVGGGTVRNVTLTTAGFGDAQLWGSPVRASPPVRRRRPKPRLRSSSPKSPPHSGCASALGPSTCPAPAAR